MSRREHVKPVLRAFLHAKSADLLFLNNHKIHWLMYMISYCLFQSELGLNQLQMTKISKKKLFLRLVYQIDRFFALIEDPQTKIPTNDYVGHQRAAKLSHRELKIFQLPYLVYFWLDWHFSFLEIFVRAYYCLKVEEFKISEILLLRLEFTVFWASRTVVKNFSKKFFLIWKQKMFRYNAQTFFVSTTWVKNVLMNFY